MKMETAVRAPRSGRVREVLASVNSQVDAGAPLLRLDHHVDEAAVSDAPTVSFKASRLPGDASDAPTRAREHLDALRAMITGYDVSAKRARTLVAEYGELRNELAQDDAELRREELALLTTFADLCELSRNRPTSEEEDPDERVHSPREHFHTYLHSLDVEQESLPEAFRTRLSRVLRHYGVDGPGTRAPSWRRRSTGCSWPSNGRPTRSRWSRPCSSGGCWRERRRRVLPATRSARFSTD